MATLGRNPQKTKNELQAGESGAQAVGQASGQLNQAYESGQDNALKSASVFGGLAQQGEENKQKQQQLNEQSRSNRTQEALEEDKINMQGAAQGVQPQGNTRAQQLRQEMEQGRLQSQMSKPLEVPGPDNKTYAKTEEQQKQDQSDSFSKRLNAQASYMRATESYNKAQITGDKEAAKRERDSLMSPIKSGAVLFNAGRKGEMTDGQWENLKELSSDVPDSALKDEIDKKIFGPRVSDFIQRRINFDALKFMQATGDMPDGELIDMASPMMGQFAQTNNQMQSFLKNIDSMTGGAMSQIYKIDSLAKRNNVVRQMSADAMLKTLANPGATVPGSMPTPSSGRPNVGQQQPAAGKPGPGKPASKPTISPTGNRAGYGNPWEDPNAERGGFERGNRIPSHQD